MHLASLLYLPPVTVAPQRTSACLANLAHWKHKYPLYVYSDARWHSSLWRWLGQAGPVRFFPCVNPEVVKSETVHHVPKLAYLIGLGIAVDMGATHFCTLETDTRVWGDNWDEAIFDEFLAQGENKVLGGTMFVWHPFNDGLDYALEFTDFFQSANCGFMKERYPVPRVFVYGGKGSCTHHKPCAYPNGALSIAKTEFVVRCFGHRDPRHAAQEGSAWDAHLGHFILEDYGASGYRRLAPLRSVYSVYGDLLSSSGMRQEMLRSGQVRGVHQIKDAWPAVP